jgi:hypothetical protein
MASKAEVAAAASRRCKVAVLLLQGVTNHSEITARLGMDPSQRRVISYDVQAIEKAWRQDMVRDRALLKQMELDRLALIEREAWAAWERSKIEKIRTRSRRRKSKEGDNDEVGLAFEQRDGDSRWLAVVLDCVAQRISLLGLADLPLESAAYIPLIFINVSSSSGPALPGPALPVIDVEPAPARPPGDDEHGSNSVRVEFP